MAADISRVRFDPLRDFAGVVLQQGRLLLDADFNELVALLDRRLRAETCDLTSFGPDPDHAGRRLGAAADAGRLPRRRSRAGTSRSGAGACTSTACSPRTTASSSTGSTRSCARSRAPRTRRTCSSRTGQHARAAADRRHAPRVPRRLAARGHAPRGSRTSSRSRSASTRRRAGRRRGRCGCCEVPTEHHLRDRRRRHPAAGST